MLRYTGFSRPAIPAQAGTQPPNPNLNPNLNLKPSHLTVPRTPRSHPSQGPPTP